MKKCFLLLFLGIAFSMAGAEGILCLTFDDRHFASWENAIPFFKKYNARATFFVSGNIDDQALAAMKKLQDAGHSIGLHSVHHLRLTNFLQKNNSPEKYLKNEIMPQLEICSKNGINIRAFAYPYSQRTPETDKILFTVFDFLRTGWFSVKKENISLADTDECFVKSPAKKQLFYGFPGNGDFDMAAAKKAMTRAAGENSILVFYAHNITRQRSKGNITLDQLAELIEYAQSIGLQLRSFNEL